MRKQWMVALASLVLAVLFCPLAAPAEPSEEETSSVDRRLNLQGTYLVTVTPEEGTPFLSLMTFTRTGEVLEESNTPGIRTVGHGQWVRAGGRRFTRTFIIFRFDAMRQFTGTGLNTATVELSEEGKTFRAAARTALYDADGQLVRTVILSENGRLLERSEFPDPPELP